MSLTFGKYDQRHYPTRSVEEGYAEWERVGAEIEAFESADDD